MKRLFNKNAEFMEEIIKQVADYVSFENELVDELQENQLDYVVAARSTNLVDYDQFIKRMNNNIKNRGIKIDK